MAIPVVFPFAHKRMIAVTWLQCQIVSQGFDDWLQVSI